MPNDVGPYSPHLRNWTRHSISSSLLLFLRMNRFAVGGQSEERAITAIKVIRKIKNAWKAGSGVLRLIPGTISLLRSQEISSASRNRVAVSVSRREQSQHSPGCLRWRAWANSLLIRIIVRAAALAPSSIGILDRAQPFGSLLHVRLVIPNTNRFESAQDLHRPVDVIHTPAAKPGAIGFLFTLDELDGLPNAFVSLIKAIIREHLQHTPSDIDGRGI